MRTRSIGTAISAALLGGLITTVALADPSSIRGSSLPGWAQGLPLNEELAGQGVVWHGNDLGAGENVVLVVGGKFPTRQAAEEANSTIGIGDLAGYYVASIDQFEGLRAHLGDDGSEFVLVSAFRTEQGASDFLEVVRASDGPALLTPRLLNRGYEYVGLGQEQHPNGKGPLIGPLAGVSTP
jgi:hypothetical protein